MSADTYLPTDRTTPTRLRERVGYDRGAVHAVLDEATVCHVGFVVDGRPVVLPQLHVRVGDDLYLHGSTGARSLRIAADDGLEVCVTVTLVDGLVLARSAFNHSVNYRSAMVFGTAHTVEKDHEKTEALRSFTDGLFPGRWETLRPMTAQELKATSVLWMDIEEATAKMRAAPPGDPEVASVRVWAGVLPMRTELATPERAPELPIDIELPEPLAALIASGRLR